jgi:hypothetical protein
LFTVVIVVRTFFNCVNKVCRRYCKEKVSLRKMSLSSLQRCSMYSRHIIYVLFFYRLSVYVASSDEQVLNNELKNKKRNLRRRLNWLISIILKQIMIQTVVHNWILYSESCNSTTCFGFNLLKPTGHVMHPQFNIQQLYALPKLYLCVLYLSENKQRLVPLTP